MVTPAVINANRVWVKNVMQTFGSPAFIARAQLARNGAQRYGDNLTIIRNEMSDRSGDFSIGQAGEFLYTDHFRKVLQAMLQFFIILGQSFPSNDIDGPLVVELCRAVRNAQTAQDFESVKPVIRDLLEKYVNGIRVENARSKVA